MTSAEVESVVFSPATRWAVDDRNRPGRMVARGTTSAGRLLVVVCDTPTASASSCPVTARPMNDRERRRYEEGD